MAPNSVMNGMLSEVAASSQCFSTDVFESLGHTNGNLAYSPFSMQLVLMMLYVGAKGKTARDLAAGTRKPHFLENVKQYVDYLEGKPDTFHISSGVFVGEGYKILEKYERKCRRYFNSETLLVDFVTRSDESTTSINDWLYHHTHNKIKDLFPAGIMTPETEIVLANAVYYKDTWKTRYNVSHTKRHFTSAGESMVEFDTMITFNKCMYGIFDGFKAMEFLYQDPEISMLILMPDFNTPIKEFERKLSSIDINYVLRNLELENMGLQIPKFKLELTMELEELLGKLGMRSIFEGADLSGINGEGGLAVTKVLHKSVLQVSELGVEAAAVTGAIIGPHSETSRPTVQVKHFKADQPLFFYILNKHGGNHVLFRAVS